MYFFCTLLLCFGTLKCTCLSILLFFSGFLLYSSMISSIPGYFCSASNTLLCIFLSSSTAFSVLYLASGFQYLIILTTIRRLVSIGPTPRNVGISIFPAFLASLSAFWRKSASLSMSSDVRFSFESKDLTDDFIKTLSFSELLSFSTRPAALRYPLSRSLVYLFPALIVTSAARISLVRFSSPSF